MSRYYDVDGREIKMFDIAICQHGKVGVITDIRPGGYVKDGRVHPLFLGIPIDADLGDFPRRKWQSKAPKVIGSMIPGEKKEVVVSTIAGIDRGVPCVATVTTLPSGAGVIEVKRECRVAGYTRRSFSSEAERDRLIEMIHPVDSMSALGGIKTV